MNKQEFVSAIAEKVDGMTKKDIALITDVAFEVIKDAVAGGDKVAISKFGSFEAREVAARECRNPQDGSTVLVKAHRKPAFKAALNFKEQVRG